MCVNLNPRWISWVLVAIYPRRPHFFPSHECLLVSGVMTVADLDKVHVLPNERKKRESSQRHANSMPLQTWVYNYTSVKQGKKKKKQGKNSQADFEMSPSFRIKYKQPIEWDLKTIVLYQIMSLNRVCHQIAHSKLWCFIFKVFIS